MTLRIHAMMNRSRANGPGTRCVIWVQGCSLGCPGCFNPETHVPDAGRAEEVEDLLQTVCNLQGEIDGVTVSGGEPLEQPEALVEFLQGVRERTCLSVVVFTGKTWKQVSESPLAAKLLPLVDVLIAGPFIQRQRVARGLLGSANKTMHFLTDRYTRAYFDAVPVAEITIEPDGTILHSGIGWNGTPVNS